jgi:hypothetical protein
MNSIQFDRTMADESVVKERLKPLVTQDRLDKAAQRLQNVVEPHLWPYMHKSSRMRPDWVARYIVQRYGARRSGALANDTIALDAMINAAIIAASEITYEILNQGD